MSLLPNLQGKYGNLDEHDRQQNELAVSHGGRILSAYNLPDNQRLWIITEHDRSVTTLLLPEDY